MPPDTPASHLGQSEHCTCDNGEAEDDRGAVLRCAVHGPHGGLKFPDPGFRRRTEEALRIAREARDEGCKR